MKPRQAALGQAAFSWHFYLAVGGALLVAALLLPLPSDPFGRRARAHVEAQARSDASMLQSALKAYQTEYQKPLSGSHAQVLRALLGDNPRKIVFIEINSRHLNAAGEFTDPWGQPYRLDLSKPGQPRIYSCGRNRIDEGGRPGSDDLTDRL